MVKIGNIELPEISVWLAPMEDVTDPPFRQICKRLGADVVISEFISSEGLIRDARKSTIKLDFNIDERPFGIQIFGYNINSMCSAAEVASSAHPDFIDINWGCPVKKVAEKGAGAGILSDIPKMIRITESVVKSTNLPVTVKTRLGLDEKNKPIVDIAERLQDVGIKAITIHGRTKAQMYKGEADWNLIGEIKNNARMKIPVIGNGDITNALVAKEMLKFGVDGIMIGRASIGNPWVFDEVKSFLFRNELLNPPPIEERVKICREHLLKSIEWKGEKLGILEMRKHYSGYFKGLKDFKDHRIKLVTSSNLDEILETLDSISRT